MSSKSFEVQGHDTQPNERLLSLELEDSKFLDDYSRVINDPELIGEDDKQTEDPHTANSYIGMEVGLPRGTGEEIERAIVQKRVMDQTGNPISKYHNNPLLDSRLFEVEYIDGGTEAFTANIIAENLLAQVDDLST